MTMEMANMLDFTDQVVLVTGARSGIGKATAIMFAQRGAKLVICSRRPCTETVAAIEAFGGEVVDKPTDVSDEQALASLIDWIMETYGKLDVAVNNAGIDLTDGQPLAVTSDDFDKTMSVNTGGVYYGLRYEIPAMLKNGKGAIINVSSVAGLIADPGMAVYVASKHAVVGLTKAAGIEYADKNIRVNGVAPSFTMTEMMYDWIKDPENAKQVKEFNWQHRAAESEEIAGPILFLASDLASFINGVTLPVDAGQIAH